MNKKLQGLLILGVLLYSVTPPIGSVYAEEKLQSFELDPFLVTAQRVEKADIDTPATTTVITAQDIENKGYASVFNALEQTIGFTAYSYSPSGDDLGGSVSRFYIRGLDKGTLVLVNGAPVNIMNYSSTGGVPIEAVERIEIIKGANSVLYGAEAMGGVVNIITKRGGKQQTTASTTYGNYNKSYSVTNQGEKYFIMAQRDYIGQVDQSNRIFPKSTYHWRDRAGIKNSLYASVNITDKLSLDWTHVNSDRTRDAIAVKNGQSTGQVRTGSSVGTYQYNDYRNNANLIYNDKENKFRSILAYNSRKLDSNNIKYKTPDEISSIARGTNYYVYGLTFDNQKTWELNNGKDTLTSGFTYHLDHYEKLEDKNSRISRNNYSIYSSYSHAFNDRLTGILGVRGEFYLDNGFDKAQNVFLPQFQLLYKVNEYTSFYTNIGKSFDMPAINSKFYTDKTSNRKPLNPQQGWTYEIGSKFIKNNDSLKVALFHMDISDKFEWVKENTIFPDGDPNTNMQINGGQFRNTGIEMEYAKILNDNWRFNLGLTFSNPQLKDGDKWVQQSARLQYNAGVQYTKSKFMGSLNYSVVADREDAYYSMMGVTKGYDHKVPDRMQLNSTLRYSPRDNQAITLNLYNILDRKNCINENENWDLPFNWTVNYKVSF